MDIRNDWLVSRLPQVIIERLCGFSGRPFSLWYFHASQLEKAVFQCRGSRRRAYIKQSYQAIPRCRSTASSDGALRIVVRLGVRKSGPWN
jgi:hypothetical protein